MAALRSLLPGGCGVGTGDMLGGSSEPAGRVSVLVAMLLARIAEMGGCTDSWPRPAALRSAAGPARNLAICTIMRSLVWKNRAQHLEGRTWESYIAQRARERRWLRCERL